MFKIFEAVVFSHLQRVNIIIGLLSSKHTPAKLSTLGTDIYNNCSIMGISGISGLGLAASGPVKE